MRWKATMFLFWFAVCLSAPADGFQWGASEDTSGAQIFFQAVALSYDGNHQVARKKFAEYQLNHPDDLLAPIRVSYDHLFDVNLSKMTKGDYDDLIKAMDSAIAIFESKRCAGTDLRQLAGDTLDCDYVGAALYSARVVWRIKRDGAFHNRSENGADDKQFFVHAERSKSPQAKFLLGIHEYEASNAKWHGIGASWALKLHGTPVDQDEAIRNIEASFANESPFADDVWFYVLRLELQHKPGAETLAKNHSPASIIARLQPKHPHNRIFADGLSSSFTDSFNN
jgi:hypothetical protein